MIFKWYVHEVEFQSYRRRLKGALSSTESVSEEGTTEEATFSDGGRLVGVKSITFKMEWSDPLYVSQNSDRDNLKVQLKPHMFELDSKIEVTETAL